MTRETQSLLEKGSINVTYKEIVSTHIEVPWKKHLKFFLSFIACICASTPLLAFPTLEPLLTDAKAFASFCPNGKVGCNEQEVQLSTLYTSVNGITMATTIISGIMYDSLGPRLSSVVGAFGSAVGLVIIWASLLHEKLSYLLYLGFLINTFMGFLNSMSMYGFIWHYPTNQAFVIGLSNASIQLSGLLGIIIPYLVNKFHIPLGLLFLFCGGLALISAVICMFVVPTMVEFQNAIAMNCPEMVTNGGDKEESFLASAWMKIKDTWDVMIQYKRDNLLFFVACTMGYLFLLTWMGSLYPYLSALLDSTSKAQSLADVFSLIFSIMGSVSAPILGILLDKLGMFKFYGILNIAILAFCALFALPHYSTQLCSFIFGLVYFNSWMSTVGQWAVFYAPSNLLGTFYGIFFSGSGIIQFVFTLVAPQLMEKYVSGVGQYLYLLIPLAACTIILQLVELVYLWRKGIPSTPPTVTPK